jgi:predicted nucleic-acid-binding Zn-ribbon protein
MRKGKCPKCSSTEIYHSAKRGLSAGDHIVRANIESQKDGSSDTVVLEHYVCSKCGYLESYLFLSDPHFPRIDRDTNWTKL